MRNLLIISICLFSIAIFGQTPRKAEIKPNTDKFTQTEKETFSKESALLEDKIVKDQKLFKERLSVLEKQYKEDPSEELKKEIDEEKLNYDISRSKDNIRLYQLFYNINPEETLQKQLKEENNKLSTLKNEKSNTKN